MGGTEESQPQCDAGGRCAGCGLLGGSPVLDFSRFQSAENAQQKRFLRSGAWFDCRLLGTPVMRKCLVHGGSR